MKKESFVYYRSFWDAIRTRPDNERLTVYDAIFLYAFDGKQSDLQGFESSIFTLIKPQIDANHRKWENGHKGGRPSSNKARHMDYERISEEITSGFKNKNLMNNEEGVMDNEEGVMSNKKREMKNEECSNENLNYQWKKPSKKFEQFWELYPNKVAKKQTEEIFEQLTPEDQSAAINNISRLYSQTPTKFVPNPSRYLNESRWEDEKVEQTYKPYISEERYEDLPCSR